MKDEHEGGATSKARPSPNAGRLRFIPMALAMIVFLAIMYVWQFASANGWSERIHLRNWGQRNEHLGAAHIVLDGFDAGYEFVSTYDAKTQGPLYILFMASVDDNGNYWCPDCQKAKKPILDVFARAPYGSRLVEIRVGPRKYWKNDENEFRQNELFYIDNIPTLMRYDGGGNSSAMLSEEYCLDYDLLEYVFRVPHPRAGTPKNNEVIVMDDPKAVDDYLMTYDNSYPLFVYFTSSYHAFNGRLWCPYCDRAEVSVTHYYNYLAPDNAVMLRGIVSPTYKGWKNPMNPFKHLKAVSLGGVPYLARVIRVQNGAKPKVLEFLPDFSSRHELQQFFSDEWLRAQASR